jgi:hypothetical protein
VCFTWTNIIVSASSWLQEQKPDRLILLLQRTFPQCVTYANSDECKDVLLGRKPILSWSRLSAENCSKTSVSGLNQQPSAGFLFLVSSVFLILNYSNMMSTLEHLLAWLLIWQNDMIRISFKRLWRSLEFTMAAPTKILSSRGSSVGKPHFGINEQPEINRKWSFTFKRMSCTVLLLIFGW